MSFQKQKRIRCRNVFKRVYRAHYFHHVGGSGSFFLVGEAVDAIVILFIILCDAILGTVQEWKANKVPKALPV